LVIQLVTHSSSEWEHQCNRRHNTRRDSNTTTTGRLQVNRRWELLDFHRCIQLSFQSRRRQVTCHGMIILGLKLRLSDSRQVCQLPLLDRLLSRQFSLHGMKITLVRRTKGPLVSSDLEMRRAHSIKMAGSTPMIDLSSTLRFIRTPHHGSRATRKIKIL